jgi:hypothetical protein
VITFPFDFLKPKLADPQRLAEIQDALNEVMNTQCRLRMVLASEYRPRPKPQATAEVAEAGMEYDAAQFSRLSEWAEEHGGKASMLGPQTPGSDPRPPEKPSS